VVIVTQEVALSFTKVVDPWPTYLQPLLILIILNLTFWCRWSSVPLHHVFTACWVISICPLSSWRSTFY